VQFFEDVFWINLLRYVSFLNQYCPADPQSFFNTIGHGETNSLISSAAPQLSTLPICSRGYLAEIMRNWLEHDLLALAVLVIGLAVVELIAFVI
jgi:hypothetical protein